MLMDGRVFYLICAAGSLIRPDPTYFDRLKAECAAVGIFTPGGAPAPAAAGGGAGGT